MWRGPERPVSGDEDLCMGGHGRSEVLRSLSRERKICVWWPYKCVCDVVVVVVVVFVAVCVAVFVNVFVVIFVIVVGEEHRTTRKRRTGAPRT